MEDNAIRIVILPVGEPRFFVLEKIKGYLAQIFPKATCEIAEKGIRIPTEAYDPKRRQYSSTKILKEILTYAEQVKADRILGVTQVDLYVPWLNFVFGEAQCLGKGALISTFRLKPEFYNLPSNQELLLNRVIKEAVHELGHTFGLDHCRNSSCVMFFSNSIQMVDTKDYKFCDKCRVKLEKSRHLIKFKA